ncbi:serine/arginine repetitive matrix protein 1 [Lampris incognitus]|uniref:serine/arginine repetitive matrix protein 1 n=1 Tax=Lampris incognitus TaxID=2546036 RepID=UPI0024B5A925|nr:serine/arginine repetitive matrix protein 1 [Lampris incognitus]
MNPAVRQEPQTPALEGKSQCEHRQSEKCTSVGIDFNSFLLKLQEDGQAKLACPRKSLTTSKVPIPPSEPEDDFLILEDDDPIKFTIPRKEDHCNGQSRQRQSKRSGPCEEQSSKDTEMEDILSEEAEKQQEPGHARCSDTEERQTVHPRAKKKGKEGNSSIPPAKKNALHKMKGIRPRNDGDEVDSDALSSQQDFPAYDFVEKQHNKKQQHHNAPSKMSKADDQFKENTSSETVGGGKLAKDGGKNAKKRRLKSAQGNRERTWRSDDCEEPLPVEALQQQHQGSNSEEQGSPGYWDSPVQEAEKNPSPEFHGKIKSKLPAKRKVQQAKPSSVGGGEKHLSEDSPLPRKRRHKPSGEWRISSSQNTEKKEVGDRPLTLKSKPSSVGGGEKHLSEDSPLPRKRRHKPSGEWWIASSQNTEKKEVGDRPLTLKSKENNRKTSAPSAIKARHDVDPTEGDQKRTLPASRKTTRQNAEKKMAKPNKDRGKRRISGETVQADQDIHAAAAEQILDQEDKLQVPVSEKRRRRPPGNWWAANDRPTDAVIVSSHPPRHNPNYHKTREAGRKWSNSQKSFALETPKNDNVEVSAKPAEGAVLPLKLKSVNTPKTVRRSVDTCKDIFTNATETPVSNEGKACLKRDILLLPVIEKTAEQTDKTVVTVDCAGKSKNTRSILSESEIHRGEKRLSDNTAKSFISGPNEEHENSPPMCIDVPPVQSVLELCGYPLEPILLEKEDSDHLSHWLELLWPPTTKNYQITPDNFNWYAYKGNVMGMQMDIHCSSFCIGKLLLGSYMKKPLCVDHSATTVFTLATGSVKLTVDGNESYQGAGQVMMVPCGHAYSIENLTDEPAVLYFNRMQGESLD